MPLSRTAKRTQIKPSDELVAVVGTTDARSGNDDDDDDDSLLGMFDVNDIDGEVDVADR